MEENAVEENADWPNKNQHLAGLQLSKIDMQLLNIQRYMMYLGKDGHYKLHDWIREMILPLRDRYVSFLVSLV